MMVSCYWWYKKIIHSESKMIKIKEDEDFQMTKYEINLQEHLT
jgi:hypothetical protein